MNIDTAETDDLEVLLKQGKILEIGEVVLEDEDEQLVEGYEPQIPVYLGSTITHGMLPEVQVYNDKGQRMFNGEVPELAIYRGGVALWQPANAGNNGLRAPVRDMQARFGKLADYLGMDNSLGERVAGALELKTRRRMFDAFGRYMQGRLLAAKTQEMTPTEFVLDTHYAVFNLMSGVECNTGRPVRESIRRAFEKSKKPDFAAILSQLPEISRAVATTEFALEVRNMRDSAHAMCTNVFDYALGLDAERQINERQGKASYCR